MFSSSEEKDKFLFRKLIKWLLMRIPNWNVWDSKSSYQVALLGYGSMAAELYNVCHPLVQKFGKKLDHHLFEIENAQDRLNIARRKLNNYLESNYPDVKIF